MPTSRELWDANAGAYDAFIGSDGDLVRREIVDPVLQQLCRTKGKRVLDAGCGNGYFAGKLQALGAREVIGVDFSAELIRRAQARFPKLKFQLADLTMKLPFAMGKFDLIVCHNVLMDLKDLDKVLREFKRTLKRQGELVFSVLHPCFSPPVAFWKRKVLGRLSRKKIQLQSSTYFNTPDYIIRLGKSKNLPTKLYHRTLEEYFMALKKAGFRVEELREPRADSKVLTAYPELYQFSRFPPTLMLRAISV